MPADPPSRVNVTPDILGGSPVIRGRRLGPEHVPGTVAVGRRTHALPDPDPWLERGDVKARIACSRLIGN